MWFIYALIILGWISIPTALLASHYQRNKWADSDVKCLGAFLPGYAAVSCLILMLALGGPAEHPQYPIVRAIHFFGISLLTLFLIVAAVLMWDIRKQTAAGGPIEPLARTIELLWRFSNLAPSVAAVLILLSGLRQVYDLPANGTLQKF